MFSSVSSASCSLPCENRLLIGTGLVIIALVDDNLLMQGQLPTNVVRP